LFIIKLSGTCIIKNINFCKNFSLTCLKYSKNFYFKNFINIKGVPVGVYK